LAFFAYRWWILGRVYHSYCQDNQGNRNIRELAFIAFQGKQKKTFFTIPEYEAWKASLAPEEVKGWTIKYYKGLGTNTPAEAKEYFRFPKKCELWILHSNSNIDTHRIRFSWSEGSQESIELAFRKDRTEERKDWLSKFVDGVHVDHTVKDLTINDFVHKELVLFSRADNIRSIPSVIDGLKPGQRKVLFACFKVGLNKEQVFIFVEKFKERN
jgi:DNA topoisomerase-2